MLLFFILEVVDGHGQKFRDNKLSSTLVNVDNSLDNFISKPTHKCDRKAVDEHGQKIKKTKVSLTLVDVNNNFDNIIFNMIHKCNDILIPKIPLHFFAESSSYLLIRRFCIIIFFHNELCYTLTYVVIYVICKPPKPLAV